MAPSSCSSPHGTEMALGEDWRLSSAPRRCMHGGRRSKGLKTGDTKNKNKTNSRCIMEKEAEEEEEEEWREGGEKGALRTNRKKRRYAMRKD